jgi:[ribosomal protein S5]-alanine N-acetyltransferase
MDENPVTATIPPREDGIGLGPGFSGAWRGVATDATTGPSSWAAVAGGLPELAARCVALRELQLSDAEPLTRHFSDPLVTQYLAPPPDSVPAFERFIEWAHGRRAAAECCCYGVVPAGGVHAVGIFQLRRLNASGQLAEWGFVIGRPHWGTGMFDVCADELLRFAFEALGVRRLEATVSLCNARGNAVLRRIGAIQTGFLTCRALEGAPLVDGAVWSLTPGDWRGALGRRPAS